MIVAGGCCTTCCCCSCCLHALGGILGAATNPAPADASGATGYAHAQAVYWGSLGVSTVVCVLLVVVTKGVLWGAGLLFLGLPLIQLLASVVALVVILTRDMGPINREAAMAAIGRITLRTIVGTLIGLVAMSPVLLLISW